MSDLSSGGSTESDQVDPLGTYAQSCFAREQAFTHAAHEWGTPVTHYRQNYAVEPRYGVLTDMAQNLSHGEAVDVSMPAVNVVWQGDSNGWSQ